MHNKKKKYLGSFERELDAALHYDKIAIWTHGLKVSLSYFHIYTGSTYSIG